MSTTSASPLRRTFTLVYVVLRFIVLTGLSVWAVAAIYYSNLPWGWLRTAAAVAYVIALIVVLARAPSWRLARLMVLAGFGGVLAWFLLTPASNNRDWQPDVAVLPYADINGDHVTIHNIRDCDYRTETDYTVRHYDQTYDLTKLQTVDFCVVYWGSPWIAHTMMSFGFGGGDYVCISIETRKEKGEEYSAIKGFFRQYELTYIIADERDLVRLRTNFRGEQVYLYRLHTDPAVARLVFLDYLREVNRLNERPQWYNAATENCTTSIRGHTKPYVQDSHFDWRILINGRIDEMAYERKTLDQSLPFAELKARSLINEKAKAADQDPAFSKRIREGLPGMK